MAPKKALPFRQRSIISSEALADVIKPFVSVPSSIRYGESMKAKLDPNMLAKNSKLLGALQHHCANMSYTKGQVTGALAIIVAERNNRTAGWNLDEGQVADYISTVDMRIRVMCRHLQQGLCRKSPPRWLSLLPDVKRPEAAKNDENEDEEEHEDDKDPEATQDAPTAPAPTKDFFFGYDAEHEKAWRCKVGSTEKDYTTTFEKPNKSMPLSPMVAKWSDGVTYSIVQFTVQDYMAKSEGRKPPKPDSLYFFETFHKDTWA